MTVRVVVMAVGSHIFQAAHVPALRESGLEVIGVHDADGIRAEAVAREHAWPVVDDLDALLALEADAAIVCAPHPRHAELVAAAVRAGLAVLVEKPAAPRLSEIDALIRLSDAERRTVAVVQQHRFRAEVLEAARMIRAGELGRIHRAVVSASYPKRSVYYTDTAWRGTWEREGGGVLLNQGLHDIDLLIHLLGKPSRIAASLRRLVHPIEAEDTADLMMAWSSGAVGTVHITSAAALPDHRIEIHGSAGALRLTAAGLSVGGAQTDFDVFAAQPGGHFDGFPVTPWRQSVRPEGGTHYDVYTDFLRALTSGTAPATSLRESRTAVEVIAAAMIAHAEERWVALPVDPQTYDALLDAKIAAARHAEQETLSS